MPVRRYQVLGERSSGTNYVKRLMGRNTDLKPTEALGWKHGFPHMMAVPPDMAVVIAVRRADAWAMSMFAKPWHTTPAMQALPFSDFIRAPWDTIIDRPRYFQGLIAEGSVGAPLQQDRDPMTGARYDTLFALRRAKLSAMLALFGREFPCIVLRTEGAQAAPEETLDWLLSGLGHPPRSAPFRPVFKRLGSKFNAAIPQRPAPPEDGWSAADLAFLRGAVDPAQEAALGYSYT